MKFSAEILAGNKFGGAQVKNDSVSRSKIYRVGIRTGIPKALIENLGRRKKIARLKKTKKTSFYHVSHLMSMLVLSSSLLSSSSSLSTSSSTTSKPSMQSNDTFHHLLQHSENSTFDASNQCYKLVFQVILFQLLTCPIKGARVLSNDLFWNHPSAAI